MNTKTNRLEPETQLQPEVIMNSFIRYKNLRCMSHTSKDNFKNKTPIINLLEDLNHYGIENLDRNQIWFYDINHRGKIYSIGPTPELDDLKKSGAYVFGLTGGLINKLTGECHRKFHGPTLGLVKVWDVDELPRVLDEIFQLVSPEFDGIEFVGDFSLDNYSPVKLRKSKPQKYGKKNLN
ncbi:MAG: hypothetical protein ACLP2P_04595 [Desulfobaccales bacterium]